MNYKNLVRAVKSILTICLVAIGSPTSIAQQNNNTELTMALDATPVTRATFNSIINSFERKTGKKVKVIKYNTNTDFNTFMAELENTKDTPDLIYDHGSLRFKSRIEKHLVEDVSKLWLDNGLTELFTPEIAKRVKVGEAYYGIPYSIHTWGFFYKQELIDKVGPIPEDWDAFVSYCLKLKELGYSVFTTSDKQPYVAAAWFEYIILRMYGLELFEQILNGEVSFQDERIQNAFIKWKQLIDLDLYDSELSALRWEQQQIYFLRNKIALFFIMTPSIKRIIDQKVRQNIHFAAFPKINAALPRYESVPSNILFISSRSKNKALAKEFLLYLAQADTQSLISEYSGASPANIHSKVGSEPVTQKSHQIISSAAGFSPFFDRGAHPDFEKVAVTLFSDFIHDPDVKKLTSGLESARPNYYSN
ncbi:ABC transporter substrate-binding protein [Aliiglaciecola sp. NS0011-25]|uniref:ABC transporter substrate-binding protein n=1 Tax=Aliiglaciecola sp. NS0011-25 TaxID=3127654 RepID=UPI00310202BE